jgi:ATP-dependent helicase/nuclease subunit B
MFGRMRTSGVAGPPVLQALARAADEWPVRRKLLVGPRRGVCREVLRRLCLERAGWVGFEPVTPHDVARKLAVQALAVHGIRVADEFDELALVDAAIDEAMGARAHVLRPFVEGLGLRDAMSNSVRALRHAGVDAAMLGRAGFRDRQKREALVRVLESYERLLFSKSVTDSAGVLRQAVSGLEAGAIELPDAVWLLLPGQSGRGLAGRLLRLLIERGATILDDDAVQGLDRSPALLTGPLLHESALSWLHAVEALPDTAPPGPISIFAAGSVNDEIREVLRRVMAANLRWDQVEIVATDPMTYGSALDTQARRLGIEVSHAAGLPVGRTRPGRAVGAWLRWVRDDFPEPVIRELIDRGDVAPPVAGSTGPALARRLRRLLIGRGHARYRAALDRAERALDRPAWAGEDRTQAEIETARERDRTVLAALRAVLDPLLDAVPPLEHRPGEEGPPVAPATLARGLLACLALVPVDTGGSTGADRTAADRLRGRLERLAETATRLTSLDGAIALIAAKLDARVPAPAAEGAAPWTASGGRLHLSDIDHGGWTGRPATFVVGLDAVRFPGASTHDTLLNDEDRRRIIGDSPFNPVPTTADRLDERRLALASMLARLRGSVTLSYSAWDATEARMVAPAPEMLQALRLMTRDASADYDELRKAVGSLACAVPRGNGRIDDADVWFSLLSRSGVLVAGTDVVRDAYPGLDRGLTAMDARSGPDFTPWHGRLNPRPDLDPRDRPEHTVSAKRLETLGTCPHRYMLHYVLGVVPPEEADFAPDRWLGAMERGRLLHAVYRHALEKAKAREQLYESEAFETTVHEMLDAEIDRMRERLAPPGEAVFELERERLRDEVGLFVRMVRRHGAPWAELELRFGGGPAETTVEIELSGGVVRAAGAIDRIDRESDGRLVIVDYKTGSPAGFGREEAVFNGGRRIQHALYSAAARRLLEDDVARAEYHFPTYRGENQRVSYEEKSLRKARGIVNALLDVVAQGRFYPTDDPDDCRFCDYRDICRVREASAMRTESPLADWSRSARDRLEELWVLRALRGRRL